MLFVFESFQQLLITLFVLFLFIIILAYSSGGLISIAKIKEVIHPFLF